jgi:hypothetical protein
MVLGEDEDSGDDDAGSRYDTVTFLAHLPDVWPLLEPIGGGVDLSGVEGSLDARRGARRAIRRKGPSGAFTEGIYLA